MYYYIALLLAILAVRGASLVKADELFRRRVFFIGSALLVIVFQSLRATSVGTDLTVYLQGYTAIGNTTQWTYQNFEIGYQIT